MAAHGVVWYWPVFAVVLIGAGILSIAGTMYTTAETREIGGIVYNDLNSNGLKDENEPGLSGWAVTLLGDDNTRTTLTDSEGFYQFTGLTNDTYTICEILKSGWRQTQPLSGPPCSTGTRGYMANPYIVINASLNVSTTPVPTSTPTASPVNAELNTSTNVSAGTSLNATENTTGTQASINTTANVSANASVNASVGTPAATPTSTPVSTQASYNFGNVQVSAPLNFSSSPTPTPATPAATPTPLPVTPAPSTSVTVVMQCPTPANRTAECLNSSAVQLQLHMNELWLDHVGFTREVIIGTVDNVPGTGEVLDRLLENQEDIGDAIRPYYGEMAGDELTRLLKEHITFAAQAVEAAKNNNPDDFNAADRKLSENADKIANRLADASSDWDNQSLSVMLHEHLDLLKEQVMARVDRDFEREIEAFDESQAQALHMSAELVRGIVRQFPERF